MPSSALPTKAILFLNNIAGDDFWDYGHQMFPSYEKFSAPLEMLRFKDSARAGYNSKGIHLTSVPYPTHRNGAIQLYGFPFLSFQVNPFDLEYPLPIHGVVITEDMRMFDFFMEQGTDFPEKADPRVSRLAWAASQNLPTVLAVHHADGYAGNMAALEKLVGMEISCPVIWHADEPDAAFLQKAVKGLMSEIMEV